MLVERVSELTRWLQWLRSSMKGPVIAIDLEWSRKARQVAVIQLSSSHQCLVLQVSKMGKELPQALRAFFEDPGLIFLASGWDSADEKMMQKTYRRGRHDFHRFIDIQKVASLMGYHRTGITNMTRRLLHSSYTKSKRVQCSDWEAGRLTAQQVKYAALDVFCLHHALAVLQELHLTSSQGIDCQTCGSRSPVLIKQPTAFVCQERGCGSTVHLTYMRYKQHCATHQHGMVVNREVCHGCGRYTYTYAQKGGLLAPPDPSLA